MGCQKLREGAKHSIYFNPENNQASTIPRHKEIPNKLANKICDDLCVDRP
jgi:hypothetical protein